MARERVGARGGESRDATQKGMQGVCEGAMNNKCKGVQRSTKEEQAATVLLDLTRLSV